MIGVFPGPFTLRDLVAMATAKERSEWAKASSIMALLANVNRAKGSREFTPDDFNPYASRNRNRDTLDTDSMRAIFARAGLVKKSGE